MLWKNCGIIATVLPGLCPWSTIVLFQENQMNIMDVVDTALLDTLFKKYIDYHRLDEHYYYAIVKTENDSVIYRSAGYPASHRISNPYKACLSCIWKDTYYHLALYFPQKNKAVFLKTSYMAGAYIAVSDYYYPWCCCYYHHVFAAKETYRK